MAAGFRFVRAFLWISLLLKLPFADAVGDICNDGDEAVWGDDSEVISPVIRIIEISECWDEQKKIKIWVVEKN